MNRVGVVRTYPGFGARCLDCRAWLTKWDWTREDAQRLGETAEHDCPRKADR